MGPKRAASAEKNKDILLEVEEKVEDDSANIREELDKLRQKLLEANAEISETRRQAVNDRQKAFDIIQGHEDEHQRIVQAYKQEIMDMCQEKDTMIRDMQQTIQGLRIIEEGRQRQEARVHDCEQDTVLLHEDGQSSHDYINDNVNRFHSTPVRPANSSAVRSEHLQRRRNDIGQTTQAVPQAPWQENVIRQHRFDIPLPRQLIFDGKISWDSFIKQFLSTALACQWTEGEMLFRLTSSLRGEAAEYVFNQLSSEATESFASLQRALESRFRERRTSASYLNELENRKLAHKEKLLEYAADIRRLAIKGYPTADELTRETINVRYFLRGLSDQQLAIAVGMKNPQTIDDAREMVETYNSLRDDVGRTQKVRTVKFEEPVEAKKVTLKMPPKPKDNPTSRCITAKEVEQIIERKLNAEKKQEEASTSYSSPNRGQGSTYRRNTKFINRNHIECFKCHKLGHYANECFNEERSAVPSKEKTEN